MARPSTSTSAEPAGRSLPRSKPRNPVAAVTYRLYRVMRVLPPRLLGPMLLRLSWALNRVTYEEVLRWLGPDKGMKTLRPQTVPFLDAEISSADSVVEIGGGPGVFTVEIARRAACVTYLDRDPRHLDSATQNCRRAGVSNVEFICGNADDFVVTGRRFDTAVLLHVLEHLDDPVGFLKRLRQVSNRLLIEVPDLEAMPHVGARLTLGAPFHWDDDHVTEFTAASLSQFLAMAGWSGVTTQQRAGVILSSSCSETDQSADS